MSIETVSIVPSRGCVFCFKRAGEPGFALDVDIKARPSWGHIGVCTGCAGIMAEAMGYMSPENAAMIQEAVKEINAEVEDIRGSQTVGFDDIIEQLLSIVETQISDPFHTILEEIKKITEPPEVLAPKKKVAPAKTVVEDIAKGAKK